MNDTSAWSPRLPAAAVLRHDRTRDADVLLLPERVVVLHGSGRAVLDLVDGTRTVDEIAALLTHGREASDGGEASGGGAERDAVVVRRDVSAFLDRLRTEGCLR